MRRENLEMARELNVDTEIISQATTKLG